MTMGKSNIEITIVLGAIVENILLVLKALANQTNKITSGTERVHANLN